MRPFSISFSTILLAGVALLSSSASSHAYSDKLYKDVLNECYKKSRSGDAGDIYDIIKMAVYQNFDNADDSNAFVSRLIRNLEKHLGRLAFGVDKKDLERQLKKLRRQIQNIANSREMQNQGPVTKPESPTA